MTANRGAGHDSIEWKEVTLFDRALVLFAVVLQYFVTVWLLDAARRRFSGLSLATLRAGFFLLAILVATGAVLSSSEVIAMLGMRAGPAMLLGALVLTYLLLATVVVFYRFLFGFLGRRWTKGLDPGRRRVLEIAGKAVAAVPVAALGYGAFVERSNFCVRELDLPVTGLAPDLEGLKILQVSDIHLSAFLREPEFARVIDAARELRPQIAVVTGDLISFQGDPLDVCLRQLSRLRADAGVFGCLGNHERYAGVEDYVTAAGPRAGIRFLRKEAERLRFGGSVLNLAGVDYQPKSQPYLVGAERLVDPGALNVLLSHNPDVLPVAERKGFHLMLSGHTHGGQVNIEILDQAINPARFFTPFVYGHYRFGQASAYVTRGVGTIGIPARIGAQPEIALLRLRKA
jgi:predicted MPP superfamily phosphohydrolase